MCTEKSSTIAIDGKQWALGVDAVSETKFGSYRAPPQRCFTFSPCPRSTDARANMWVVKLTNNSSRKL